MKRGLRRVISTHAPHGRHLEHLEEVDLPLRARALGLLFLAGATIGLLSLLLPHPSHADMSGLYSNVGLAYAGGAFLSFGARRLPGWIVHPALVAGTLLIMRAVLLSGDSVSFYAVWFIWVALYAFYFLPRTAAIGYIVLAVLVYGFTLWHDPPSSVVARWLTTVATLVVAGGFIDTLVSRSRRYAARAAQNAGRMAQVTELALRLAALSDPVLARAAIAEGAATLTGAGAAVLWEGDSPGTPLRATAADVLAANLAGLTVSDRACPPGVVRAWGSRTAIWSAEGPHPQPQAASAKPSISLWQPIVENDRVLAVLELVWQRADPREDGDVNTLCAMIAAQASVTLERLSLLAKLEHAARTDELTGLPNRRAWQEALPRELRMASRSQERLCVALLDLDHFKRYNDTRGHQTGDLFLREVAVAWSGELRGSDMLARYGGEEFALVLRGCSVDYAVTVVERLRQAMPSGQTCSAGIAAWQGEPLRELLDRADRALYQAKRSGRDQIVVAGEEYAPSLAERS